MTSLTTDTSLQHSTRMAAAARELLRTERLVELTQALVRIPSETGHEHAIGDWLVDFLEGLGLSVRRLPVEDAGDTIVGTLAGGSASEETEEDGGTTMMLNFHLDTFDAFEGWVTEPFEPQLSEDGSRIIGLGAHDMKAGAACVLGVVEAIVRSQTALGSGTLLVVGTTDEEYWSRGAHELAASGLIDHCSYNIVPEPVRVLPVTRSNSLHDASAGRQTAVLLSVPTVFAPRLLNLGCRCCCCGCHPTRRPHTHRSTSGSAVATSSSLSSTASRSQPPTTKAPTPQSPPPRRLQSSKSTSSRRTAGTLV